jgi:hypothetical protein
MSPITRFAAVAAAASNFLQPTVLNSTRTLRIFANFDRIRRTSARLNYCCCLVFLQNSLSGFALSPIRAARRRQRAGVEPAAPAKDASGPTKGA